jgi:hypothetical protein
MNELVTLSWRAYPAACLLAAGALLAFVSAYRAVARARRVGDPRRALAIMLGFRACIVGLAVAAIGAAWWWQIGWLFGLALVIAGEELLESSVVIAALKHDGKPVPRYRPGIRRRGDVQVAMASGARRS